MANTTTSSNMNLTIPVVGQDPGPQYATDINNCLGVIDQHDHSPGRGVQITPDGLNITSDLPMGGNSLTEIKSLLLTPQTSVSTLDALYASGVDLYFNDGSGNMVRITQNGGVAGSPGSISGLTSPASASYVSGSQTFVWQSNTNVAASLDARNVILRNSSASSFGLTLSPPSAMGSDYTITLPAAPASTKILRMASSGAIAADLDVDNSTIEINSNQIRIKNQGVTQDLLAPRTVSATAPAGGLAVSPSCGAFSSTTASYIDITNLSVSLVTTGRPVRIELMSDGTAGSGTVGVVFFSQSSGGAATIGLLRDATQVSYNDFVNDNNNVTFPVNGVSYIDTPVAGTYTYKAQILVSNNTAQVRFAKLVAYEL